MKLNVKLKKYLTLSLAALMLAFTGCGKGPAPSSGEPNSDSVTVKEKPTLTVCMDMDIGSQGSCSSKLANLLKDCAPEFKENYKLSVEPIPGDGPNRESAIDHIRVEMLAGKGPDLFICQSPRAANPDFGRKQREVGLFQYPRALMERNMFLPLDDYIENAAHMEWDKLYPQIMEAGRNEHGQLILPIGWTMSFTAIDNEIYSLPDDLPMTFDEMLASDDPGIIMSVFNGTFGDSLGEVADYEKDEPAFTQEELASHLEGLRKNLELRTAELSDSLNMPMPANFSRINASHFSQATPDSVIIPQYNRQGGATAYITCFGAVNINAEQPDAAFLVLDALLSKDAQQLSELLSFDRGAPVHMELLQDKVSVPFTYNNRDYQRWYLSEYNYGQLQELIRQINVVDFPSPVHHELSELYRPYMDAETQEEREKLVSDAYSRIRMMLAES